MLLHSSVAMETCFKLEGRSSASLQKRLRTTVSNPKRLAKDPMIAALRNFSDPDIPW